MLQSRRQVKSCFFVFHFEGVYIVLKVVYGAFEEESNTFSPVVCKLEQFEALCCLEGDAVLPYMRHKKDSASGILETLEAEGVEVIPTMAMLAQSSGRVDRAVCDLFVNRVLEAIEKNKPVDGVILAFHGATCLTDEDDGMGVILEQIRAAVGEDVVISAATDLHANITPKSIRNADVIAGYQTYPHVDIYETGVRAAKLGLMYMRAEKKPYMAYAKLPLMLPSNGCDTSRPELVELHRYAQSMVDSGKIIDYTIYYLQPWLDVKDCGVSILAVSQDEAEAREAVRLIGQKLFDLRHVLVTELVDLDEILDFVSANETGKVVVLSDAADNTSGGAAGDSTEVLSRLISKYPHLRAALVVVDPVVPYEALKVGEGNTATFTLGGKLDPAFQQPLTVEARVVKNLIYEPMEVTGPYTGYKVSFGQTSLLRVGNVDVIVCEVPQIDFSPTQFTGIGMDFADYDCVVCKSTIAFRAWFKPVTDLMFCANTTGSTSGDLLKLPFKHIERPMYPFDPLDGYRVDRISIAHRIEK